MRTLVEISDKQINDLAIICKAQNATRAEIIGQAIQAYLEKTSHRPNVLLNFGKNSK